MTFSLPGFNTLKREGLELTTGFTATVNADLNVGALEETITVSGEAPVVDIQNVRQQTTLARSTLDALPTTGRLAQYATLIPGATLGSAVWQSVGGLDERGNAFGIHGSRATDNAPVMNGLVQRLQGGAVFVFNNLTFQEVVVETSGLSAERNTGGVQMNIVPKDGGNTFSGSFSTSISTPDLQSDNLTDELRARGLGFSPSLKKHNDTGGAVGGPLVRDKLWFFNAYRFGANQQYQQGNYFNQLQNQRVGIDPAWRVTFYEPDLERPAFTDDFYRDYSLRLTWQAAAKHKIVASYQVQPNCSCFWPLLEPAMQQNIQGIAGGGRWPHLQGQLPAAHQLDLPRHQPPAARGRGVGERVQQQHHPYRFDCGAGHDCDYRAGDELPLRLTRLVADPRRRLQGPAQPPVPPAPVGVVHHRVACLQGRGRLEPVPARAFRTGRAISTRSMAPGPYMFRNRVPQSVVIWATPFEALWRSHDYGAYATGSVDDPEAHAESRRAIQCLQRARASHADAGRPVGAGAPVPGDGERAELDQHQSAARRGVRPVRQRQDGGQGVVGPVYAVLDCGGRRPGEQPGGQHSRTWTDADGQLRA